MDALREAKNFPAKEVHSIHFDGLCRVGYFWNELEELATLKQVPILQSARLEAMTVVNPVLGLVKIEALADIGLPLGLMKANVPLESGGNFSFMAAMQV